MSQDIKTLPREKLEALIRAFELISSSFNPEEVLKIVLEQISKLLNAEAGSIFLLDERTNELQLKYATNLTNEEKKGITVPLGKGLAGYVAEKGEILNIKDVMEDNRFFSQIDEITGFKTRNILTVPLKNSEKIIGVLQALNKKNQSSFTEEDEILSMEFSRLVGLTLEKIYLHAQLLEKKSIETDLMIANSIQNLMLPSSDLIIKNTYIRGYYKPANYVGGDYYDYFQVDENKILVVLADVSGKGAQASLIMMSVKAYLSSAIESNLNFITISNKLNKFLAAHTPTDKFITIFLGLIDLQQNKIQYINSGHDPALIITNNGEVIELKSNNIVMGVLDDFEFISSETAFPNNSFLFTYSDGLTEAHNHSNQVFGFENLKKVLLENKNYPLNLFQILPEKIFEHASGREQFDDMTFLIVVRNLI